MGALSRLSGAPRRVLGASVHCVCASEQLLGPATLRLSWGLDTNGRGAVEVGLLVVEQHLVFVASALCVIQYVLCCGAARLREPGVGLPGLLLGVSF